MQTANDQWNCSRMDLETAQKKQRRPILSLVSFSSTPVPSEEPLKLSSLPPTSLDGEAPGPAWRSPSRLVQTFLLQPKFCWWLAQEEGRCLAKIKFDGEHKKAAGEVSGAVSATWPGFLETYKDYKDASLNSLDVGNYVGRCLAGMARFQLNVTWYWEWGLWNWNCTG